MAAHRSHRIQSPDAGVSLEHDVPNGCNQCHADRSLAWTAESLGAWYGQPPVPGIVGDRASVSEQIYQLEKGHALSRAIAVQMLGSENALEAAPGAWRVPFLADGLEDSYPPVRQNAHRSLRKIAGFQESDFVYFAGAEERARQVAAIRARWSDLTRARLDEGQAATGGPVPESVPLHADGSPIEPVRRRLQAERDQTPLMIAE